MRRIYFLALISSAVALAAGIGLGWKWGSSSFERKWVEEKLLGATVRCEGVIAELKWLEEGSYDKVKVLRRSGLERDKIILEELLGQFPDVPRASKARKTLKQVEAYFQQRRQAAETNAEDGSSMSEEKMREFMKRYGLEIEPE
jgi:hypothetical protein